MSYPYNKIEVLYVEENRLRQKLNRQTTLSDSEEESFSRLDNIPLSHIEKYLRKKKLEKIKK